MEIAVIDDGISTRLCPELPVEEKLYVAEDGSVHPEIQEPYTDHGTTCAYLIQKYTSQVSFISIRIFQTPELKTGTSQLLGALKWCWQHQIHLIHMSTGCTQLSDFDEIRTQAMKMCRQGQIIVAAGENHKKETVPAWLYGVVGVAARRNLERQQIQAVSPGKTGVMFLASSRHLLWNHNTSQYCNSYAAPVVTARIHSIIEIHSDYDQKKILKEMNYPTKRMWQLYPDYLSEVTIWDPGGQRCVPADTNIPVKKVITDKQLNLREVDDQTQLVVLPSKTQTLSQKIQIKKAAERADSVTVLGRFPGLGRYSRTGRFWEFSGYGTYWRERGSYERDITEPVPVIWIEPRQECSRKLMRALSQKLNANGYVNLCVSKDFLSPLYGIRYIPNEMKWENAIRCIEKGTELSVLIIEGTGRVHTKEDFSIRFTGTTSFKSSEHQLCVPEKENIKYLEKIYQIIIE